MRRYNRPYDRDYLRGGPYLEYGDRRPAPPEWEYDRLYGGGDPDWRDPRDDYRYEDRSHGRYDDRFAEPFDQRFDDRPRERYYDPYDAPRPYRAMDEADARGPYPYEDPYEARERAARRPYPEERRPYGRVSHYGFDRREREFDGGGPVGDYSPVAERRPPLEEMADEELMAQFQQGVEQAFNILVDRYTERLSFYLYRFVKDQRQVEDLLQETFMRVYRNRYSYEPIAKFSTWLYTIAGNLARSEYRRRKRQRTYSLQSSSREGEEYEMQIPSETLAPDRHAERGIQATAIHRALAELPEDFREVVILRDIQQLSYEEIADITGLPLGTVKSRINRGRARLQDMLQDVYSMYRD